MPRNGSTELSAHTQATKAFPGAAATALRKAAHMAAQRSMDVAMGSHEGWKESPIYWASMKAAGYSK